ncbi:hypothetical protein VTI74DRAFT_3837 [Chaetomium olivicolor]
MTTLQSGHSSAKEPNISESEKAQNGAWDLSTRMAGDLGSQESGESEGSHQPKSNFHKWIALTALAGMWSNAQAPLYLYAGAPVYVYGELGGTEYWVWYITGNLLATAAISPFVGALSDLMGRRWVAIVGHLIIILGQVICGTAQNMPMFIAGMSLTGIGSGINELTCLAGTAELVPISRRGYYVAGIVLTILPFLPSVMFAQLIAYHSTWRYIAVVTAGWTFLGLIVTVFGYFPPPRACAKSWKERMDLLKRTDFLGGFLSIVGLAGFEAGLHAGGYQYPWRSAQTLVPLILGVVAISLFVMWEGWGAKYPMVPRNMSKAPRTLWLTMVITFVSGANFFSVLLVWPPEAYNVYGHEPVGVGVRGMPFAFGVYAGCVVSLVLLSFFKGHIKSLIFGASAFMTVGCGCLSLARVDNINLVYLILFIAGLGVGGITIPVSTVASIICTGDVIATVTALTISIRIVGGAVGYAVYFNVWLNKLIPELGKLIAPACAGLGITNRAEIGEIIHLTSVSLIKEIKQLPGVTDEKWVVIVAAGQQAFANAYPWAYYCSVAFGMVSVIASLFLEDISPWMDDTIVAKML